MPLRHYAERELRGKALILSMLAAAAPAVLAGGGHIRFADLGLHPDVFSIGFFTLRWYSLAYIAGILVGWWYLLKLLAQPGAPMARRHADDLVFYATLGIILGGRIGYVLFYSPDMLLHPLRVFRLWDGGMSFHGGVIGTSIGLILFARKHKLNWLRVHDYIACVVPFGLFFGRLANFVNGELWGKPADVPWAIVFERTVPFDMAEPARHPSQLYEAGLEGIALFAILWFAFWRTKARYQPGKLVGLFVLGYGVARFIVEFFREPDAQFRGTFIEATGIHMGQWLCVPMIVGGLYLVLTAPARRVRVEPIAGGESVA
jgi:phosphatidylglycerol:prolipoprotein diacylglycerol transferase